MPDRPTAGAVEERALATVTAEGRRIRGRIPYGVESRDMGGWREVIEPGALRGARLDDLIATVDHRGLPLGRYPGTLEVEDRSDGLHWSLEPPASRADVREAIERGDLRAGSWRMVVAPGGDEWRGNVRHIHEIRELRDVAVATAPAYPDAAVELRTHDGDAGRQEGATMPENQTGAATEQRTTDNQTETEARTEQVAERTEERVEERTERRGVLRVEDRASAPRTLADAYRAQGFPGETATLSWTEFDEARTASFDGEIDALNPTRRQGVALGHDRRYAYPAFPTVAVDGATTSVQVLRQSVRNLPDPAEVIRDIDATTAKPEVDSELELVNVPLNQVAAVQSGIPNIVLEQAAIGPLVETDLRLAIDEALDALVIAALGETGAIPQDGPLLVGIRKAITFIDAMGYRPDTLILTPGEAEALDLTVAEAGTEHYLYGAGVRIEDGS